MKIFQWQKLWLTLTGLLCACLVLTACTDSAQHRRAVFLLLDTSGTYTEELGKAQVIINYLLSTLDSGDSLAVARIDSGSFTEKNIIAKVTFDERPSVTNDQKRLFQSQMNQYVESVARGSANTDITGGLIQAVDFLEETRAGEKTVLIFSDMEEDLPKGHIRDFPISVEGVRVVALNVTKLRSDNIDPRVYQARLDNWEQRVVDGGGRWMVLNDLERINTLVSYR